MSEAENIPTVEAVAVENPPWEPSDGTPGQAAEPQPEAHHWTPKVINIPGPARIVYNNPGRTA
jgi:hypothetical protein